MEYRFEGNEVIIESARDFSLEETFECGQCFRWSKDENGDYIGVCKGKGLKISEQDGNIIFHLEDKEDFETIWQDYFDLKLDYAYIRTSLSQLHPLMLTASRFAPGIRILNQEPWEALISFIISQNNNIPRIKGIVSRLCDSFGEVSKSGQRIFPSAKILSSLNEEDLAPIRCGFRAKYIIDASKKVNSGEISLESIAKMPIDEARRELMKIKGVGPKVAECTLLYGMHRLECFPMDVWMKRAMSEYFPDMTPSDFGKYAGIAQQYIFHYSRLNMNKNAQ